MSVPLSAVDSIRTASRLLVRELGFMHPTLAATPYSASAVHALLEIEAHEPLASSRLVQLLSLEKSSVSRMLAKLIAAGELLEDADPRDARAKRLRLTAQGRQTVEHLHAYGQRQVQNAFEHLNPSQQQAVAQGLCAYADALKTHRLGGEVSGPSAGIAVATGYRPGMVGRIAEMHASYYAAHAGFGQFFESKVAAGAAEFAGRLQAPCNRVWLALRNDRIVGSLAIDGEDLGNNHAHLRWFILDDGCRGSGVGRRLMADAMAFCDIRGFSQVHLWTFKGLHAARTLYESFGFALAHEAQGDQWGSPVTEQQFIRVCPPG